MPSLDAVKRSVREHASGALPPRVPSLLDDCANVLHRPRKARVGNRKLTLAAMVFAVAALAAVVVAGVLATDAATATDFAQKNLGPSLAHPFGTDWMGRDMLLRTLAGLSTSVLVGLLAATVSSVIALVMGAVAALGGKKADAVVTWLIDLMMGIPHIVLLILISFALGKGFWGVAIGVAVTHWPSLTRVLRAEILQCKQSAFVAAARKLGQGPVRIAALPIWPWRASWGRAPRASRRGTCCPTCCRSSSWASSCCSPMPSCTRRP